MASNNRATLINKVIKVAKKHYQPVAAAPTDRTVLEHLLIACCLENSPHDAADKVFETLSREHFDWNEVRVTSLRELVEAMKPLNDPKASATRLKRVLQSVFETHYSFDLEALKKQNIGQAIKQLDKYNGTTSFTVAYVTQNALGGHSIAINEGLLRSMQVVGVISDAEAAKGVVPGLERAIPKTKGMEIGSLLHQLGVELHRSPYGPTIRKLLLEIDPKCKSRLPKRPSKKEAEKSAPAPESKVKEKAAPAKKAPVATPKPAAKTAAKKSTAKKTGSAASKKKPAKKTATKKGAKKKVVKKKKAVKKKPTVKKKKKAATTKKRKKLAPKGKKKTSSNKRLTKRKPR